MTQAVRNAELCVFKLCALFQCREEHVRNIRGVRDRKPLAIKVMAGALREPFRTQAAYASQRAGVTSTLLPVSPDMPAVYICPVVWLPETFDKCFWLDMEGQRGGKERMTFGSLCRADLEGQLSPRRATAGPKEVWSRGMTSRGREQAFTCMQGLCRVAPPSPAGLPSITLHSGPSSSSLADMYL